MIVSIYTPDRQRLRGLSAKDATVLFRSLLYADAGRLRLQNIRISVDETNTADGGIDAFADRAGQSGDAESGSFHFQLKTGTSFRPWREGDLKKELFGSSKAAPTKGALGAAVKACMDTRGTYVVVCFAHDLQPDKATEAYRLLRGVLKACGYRNPHVEVWGTGDLAAMLERYPSLCMDLNERNFDGPVQTFTSWALNAEMRLPFVFGPRQTDSIQRVGALLTGDAIQHVRLIGEPGLGKTRLALEALRAEPTLQAATVYVPKAEDFQRSRLFNELLRPDRAYEVVLVIDECDESERASIFHRLKGRKGIKLVTIDHGPDASADQLMEVVQVPPLRDEDVEVILESYVGTSEQLHHWVPWCEGSARVAHALGENLNQNPDDLLKSPATVDIWGRYIEGYQEGRDADHTRTVLEHISLFRKFGFRPPVEAEGVFIAKLAQRADLAITRARFNRIVERLTQKRILQGGHTLRIVPRALHIYLWREWWNNQGQAEDLGALLDETPTSLKRWFAEMLIYANAVEPAKAALSRAVAGGAFSSDQFLRSEEGASFISILAEADPLTGMRVLSSALGNRSLKGLAGLGTARHSLVRALCKLAVHREHFSCAVHLLARLSHGDDSTYSNNSRGSLCELFQLNEGPTQASPQERLDVLAELFSGTQHERHLALAASVALLNTLDHTRVVGVEYQGLAPALRFWRATTWSELFDAWRSGLLLLERQVREDDVAWQKDLSAAIVTAASELLRFEALEDLAIDTLGRQLAFPGADLNGLAMVLVQRTRNNYEGLPEKTIAKLQSLLDRLGTGSFERRFERFVCFSTYDEDYRFGGDGAPVDDPEPTVRVQAIAREFMQLLEQSPADVEVALTAEGHRIRLFGMEVAKLAGEPHDWLLLMLSLAVEPFESSGFFTGYMEQLFRAERVRWESLALALLDDGHPAQWRLRAAAQSGVSLVVATRFLNLLDQGLVQPDLLGAWVWSLGQATLNESELTSIVNTLLTTNSDRAALVGLELVYTWCDVCKRPCDDDLVWKVLSDPRVLVPKLNPRDGYRWKRLSKGYLARNPMQDMKFYQAILSLARSSLLDVMSPMFEFAAELAFASSVRAWDVLAGFLSQKGRAGALVYWLGGGTSQRGVRAPIEAFSPKMVLDWIAADPSNRAALMVDVLPRTLDESSGQLTLGFLDRFGANRELRASVSMRFCTGSTRGPLSMAYLGKRDAARKWLSSTSSTNVSRWAKEFIEQMTLHADEARIQEERMF